jgi:hypothetical protein
VTASNIDEGYASAVGSVSISDLAAYTNEDNSNGFRAAVRLTCHTRSESSAPRRIP